MIKSIYEDFATILEEPTDSQPGSYRVRLGPDCGMDIAGCFIEVEMRWLEVDTMEMYYEVLTETAEGLSDEQIEELQY